MPDVASYPPAQEHLASVNAADRAPAPTQLDPASQGGAQGDSKQPTGSDQVSDALGPALGDQPGTSPAPARTSELVSELLDNPPVSLRGLGLLQGSPLEQPAPPSGQVEVLTRPESAPATVIIAPSPSRPIQTTAILSVINPPSPAPSANQQLVQPPSPDLALAPASSTAPASASAPAPTPSPGPSPGPCSPGPAESGTKAAAAVPAAKKFTSSLSVNKQFLAREAEKAKLKATEKAKQTVAAKTALSGPTQSERHPTPPVPTPATSHPRLLSGKISTATAADGSGVYVTPRDVAAAAIVAKEQAAKRWNTPTPDQQTAAASAAGAAEPKPAPAAAGPFGGMGPGGRPLQRPGARDSSGGGGGWRSHAYGEAQRAPSFGGSEFPTAQEAAQEKNWRAQALVEQAQAKERAEKQKAAAAAAQNAHLLEGLDAFRGVHLDPNASHWDEMGDENDDFLDDTIEFGDGTQYKIIEELKQEVARPDPDELRPPHPSLAVQLEKPLGRDESPGAPVERVERFRDDFTRRGGESGPPKALFNAKDGRMEPYAGPNRAADKPPHLAGQPRRPSMSSVKPGPPPMAWGRPAVPPAAARAVAEQDYPTLGQTGGPGRRASNDHQGGRPSFNGPSGGERELPPHLRGNAPQPRSAPSAVLSPPRPRQPSLTGPPAAVPVAQAVALAPAPVAAPVAEPVAPVIDLDELHATEMRAGAERARLRRQKEEEENEARKERAKKKAQELADKMDAEAAARRAAEAPPPPPPVAPVAPATAGLKSAGQMNGAGEEPTPAATVNSWRKPLVATGQGQGPDRPQPTHFHPPQAPPQHSRPNVVPASAVAAVQAHPTQILARQGPPHLAHGQAQTNGGLAKDPAPHVQPAAEPSRRAVPSLNTVTGAHAAGGHARSPSDGSEAGAARRGRTRTSSVSDKYGRSPALGHTQDMTSLEAVMSRVKLEMASQEGQSPGPGGRAEGVPAPEKHESRAAKRAAAKQAKAPEPAPVPVVRLPGKRVKQPTQEAVPTGAKVEVPEVRLPSSLQVQRGRSDRVATSPAALGAHAGSAPTRPPSIPYAGWPAMESAASREARDPSPPPVWRRYSVKLGPVRQLRPVPHKKLAEFRDGRAPPSGPVDAFSWVPLLKGVDSVTCSRDEWLLPNWQKDKGPRAWVVSLPKRRLPPRATFATRAGDEVQEAYETRRGEEDLFEKPAAKATGDRRAGPNQRAPSAGAGGRNTLLAGGALTSPVEEVEEREVVSGVVVEVETVTVTSGLGGEEVPTKAGQELAPPGGISPTSAVSGERRLSITYTTTTTTTNEPNHAPSSALTATVAPLPPLATPGWAPSNTSVLNPSTPGLWSAPTSTREARSRAVSHDPSTLSKASAGHAAINSLQGLVGAEEDDVTAALPNSIEALSLGFRSDEGESTALKAHPPRLSAAAPEFAALQARPAGAPALQSEAPNVLGLTSGAGAAVAAQFPASGYPTQFGAAVHSHVRQGSSPAQFDVPAAGAYGHHAALGHAHSHSAYAATEPAYLTRPYSPAGVSPYSPQASAASVSSVQYGRGSTYAPQGYVHGREGYPGYASSPAAASAAAYGGLGGSAASSPVQQSAYYGAAYSNRGQQQPAGPTPTSYAGQSPIQQAYASHPSPSAGAGQGGYGAVARGGSYGAVGGVGAAVAVVRGSSSARPVNVGPAGAGYGRPGLHSSVSLGGSGAYGAYSAAAYGTGPGSAPGSIHHSPAGGAGRALAPVGSAYGAMPGRPGSGSGSGGREAFVSKPYVGGPSPVLMPAALPVGRGVGAGPVGGGAGAEAGAFGAGARGFAAQGQYGGFGQGARGSGVGGARAYW